MLSTMSRDVICFPSLCEELWILQGNPTIVTQDIVGDIAWANDISLYKGNKHLDTSWHYVCDHITRGHLKLVQVPTEEEPANVLTKPLYDPS